MKRIIVGILTAAAMLLSIPSSLHAGVIDDLNALLATTASTDDSISIMYDIFDLSDKSSRTPIAWKMLDIAERTDNDSLGLDMLRHLANTYTRNDSVLELLDKKCSDYPDGNDRRATHTFIALRRAGYMARYTSEADRLAKIRETINRYQSLPADATPYDRIERLGTLCILLGNGSHISMLAKYVDKAIEMAKSLPAQDLAVRNIIFNQAASVYTNHNHPEKAINVYRMILSTIDRMEEDYHKSGRKYRNLDTSRYNTYRSLLQNYKGLQPDEIQECYDSITAIAARNAEVANDMKLGVVDAYYYMAVKDYTRAIPLLESIIDKYPDNFSKVRAMRNLIAAADSTGNKDILLKYTTLYNRMLEENMELSAQNTYTEFQTIYDVNELQIRNARLELANAEAKMKHQRVLLVAGIIAFIIMLIVLGLLLKAIKKSRKLATGLEASNEALRNEQANLLAAQQKLIEAHEATKHAERCKAEFIDNMSREITTPLNAIVEYSHLIVDCADNDKKKYLLRYADIVRLNTELLNTIVHDLLDVGSLEKATLSIKRYPVLVGDICRLSVESVRSYLQPGVTINFEQENAPDTYITTDSRRVEQVLINLLSNAAKFTSEGSISLSYRIDRTNNSIIFAVADTGIGIPKGKEEEIFDRFRKLDRNTQGNGLGLPICRMIAELLNGSVKVDTTRRGQGSTFLFTIPIS